MLFRAFWGNFNGWIFNNMFKLAAQAGGSNFGLNIPSVTPASEISTAQRSAAMTRARAGAREKMEALRPLKHRGTSEKHGAGRRKARSDGRINNHLYATIQSR